MFEVDEVVNYNQYICKIKRIKTNNMTGKDYYVMNPVDDESLIIDVPVENKLGNIKKLISKKEAEDLIKSIPEVETLDIQDKFIEQKYKELMNGSKEDLIKIIKTAYLRNDIRKNNNKKISEKDDNYLKKAEKLLYNELMYSLSMTYEEVKEYIIDYCSKS